MLPPPAAVDWCALDRDPRTPERVRRCLRRPGLEWRSSWSRAGAGDAIVAISAGVVGLVFTFVEPRDPPSWETGLAVDDDVRDALVLSTRDAREAAAILSDDLLALLLLYPFVVDVFVIGLLIQDSADWAIETAIISALSLSLAFVITTTSKTIASRQRPYVSECAADPEYAEGCDLADRDRNASFFSGHTSMAFASAGLLCAHHTNVAIHGNALADGGVCVGALLAASTVGALRIMADAHWFSDVLLGAAIGLGIGWLMPVLVRYQDWNLGGETGDVVAVPVPQIGPDRAGLAVVGAF